MKGLKITKWGNGQGVHLPVVIMNLLSLKIGDELLMEIEDDKIILTSKKRKPMTLAERFASYKGPTIQKEFWTDGPTGKEVI